MFHETGEVAVPINNLPAERLLTSRTLENLQRLVRRMLLGFPNVKRWDETDDVLHTAVIRLLDSLSHQHFETDQNFCRYVAQQIRWTLLDLARSHAGQNGLGANHDTWHRDMPAESTVACPQSTEPVCLPEWVEFHQSADRLPPEEREAFDLRWYMGLTNDEAASRLGVSRATFMRRWRKARVLLVKAMEGARPSG